MLVAGQLPMYEPIKVPGVSAQRNSGETASSSVSVFCEECSLYKEEPEGLIYEVYPTEVGSEYYVLSQRNVEERSRSTYVIISSSFEEQTIIEVIPSCDVFIASKLASQGVAEVIILGAGKSIYLKCLKSEGSGISGTLVRSLSAISVFSGIECLEVPLQEGSPCAPYAVQIPAKSKAGSTFVSVPPRGGAKSIELRVLVLSDETVISYSTNTDTSSRKVNTAEVLDIVTDSTAPTLLKSSAPVIVFQAMKSWKTESYEISQEAAHFLSPISDEFGGFRVPIFETNDFEMIVDFCGEAGVAYDEVIEELNEIAIRESFVQMENIICSSFRSSELPDIHETIISNGAASFTVTLFNNNRWLRVMPSSIFRSSRKI